MDAFDKCIERRSLVRIDHLSPEACTREVATARADLDDVEFLLEHDRFRRATVTAYYAMFHAARALVLHKGFAEKSHYCLVVAFEHLYADAEDGLFLARALARARSLRENADYHGEFDEGAARDTAEVASRFVAFAERELEAG
jgi:uncharacterized protein (UPF0332 family)